MAKYKPGAEDDEEYKEKKTTKKPHWTSEYIWSFINMILGVECQHNIQSRVRAYIKYYFVQIWQQSFISEPKCHKMMRHDH